MSENFNFLFQYLDKEHLTFDKSEFEFQIKSHPDYPSLLSISDTLSFFNIDNGTIPLEVSDIEFLPDPIARICNPCLQKTLKKYKLILPSFVMTLTVVAQLYGQGLQIRAIESSFSFMVYLFRLILR